MGKFKESQIENKTDHSFENGQRVKIILQNIYTAGIVGQCGIITGRCTDSLSSPLDYVVQLDTPYHSVIGRPPLERVQMPAHCIELEKRKLTKKDFELLEKIIDKILDSETAQEWSMSFIDESTEVLDSDLEQLSEIQDKIGDILADE